MFLMPLISQRQRRPLDLLQRGRCTILLQARPNLRWMTLIQNDPALSLSSYALCPLFVALCPLNSSHRAFYFTELEKKLSTNWLLYVAVNSSWPPLSPFVVVASDLCWSNAVIVCFQRACSGFAGVESTGMLVHSQCWWASGTCRTENFTLQLLKLDTCSSCSVLTYYKMY